MLYFPYTKNTPININGEVKNIRFYNGMYGDGSREFWINDKEPFFLYRKCIIYSDIDENKNEEFTFIRLEDYYQTIFLITKKDLEKISPLIEVPYKILKI